MCQRLVNGHGSWIKPAELVCHCLLIETSKELVLVDTGLGSRDVTEPARLGTRWVRMNRPKLDMRETAVMQIEALGYQPEDVGHIILTHLDLDHAGGLSDFPQASVHVLKSELDSALGSSHRRYRQAHWSHHPEWIAHGSGEERWFDFRATRLPMLDAEILLIPLAGHTIGHTGVAVRQDARWLLHCGDAYLHRGTLATPPNTPPALRVFDHLLQSNGKQRLACQQQLRELALNHSHEVDLFCSHDPMEFRTMQRATT
jgi:glyoxylase-like metal-dependent hydrolase (beta-lactamase superfamily II)